MMYTTNCKISIQTTLYFRQHTNEKCMKTVNINHLKNYIVVRFYAFHVVYNIKILIMILYTTRTTSNFFELVYKILREEDESRFLSKGSAPSPQRNTHQSARSALCSCSCGSTLLHFHSDPAERPLRRACGPST
jgi:hypothetical protein